MKTRILSLVTLLVLGTLGANAAALEPSQCDRLAAHPWDPQRVGEPIYWNRIPAARAIAECRKAVETEPSPHNMFQYARALSKAWRYEEAADWLLRSAESGYAQAEFSLGDTYEYGEGVPRSRPQARLWYTRAASHGHEKAKARLNGW